MTSRDPQKRLWVDFEAPIEKRIVKRCLNSFRFQLIEWEFSRQSVSFDVDSGILKVEGKDVLKAEVLNDEFGVTWLQPEWGTWQELQSSKEFGSILTREKERLAQSRANRSKGSGKGLGQ